MEEAWRIVQAAAIAAEAVSLAGRFDQFGLGEELDLRPAPALGVDPRLAPLLGMGSDAAARTIRAVR